MLTIVQWAVFAFLAKGALGVTRQRRSFPAAARSHGPRTRYAEPARLPACGAMNLAEHPLPPLLVSFIALWPAALLGAFRFEKLRSRIADFHDNFSLIQGATLTLLGRDRHGVPARRLAAGGGRDAGEKAPDRLSRSARAVLPCAR